MTPAEKKTTAKQDPVAALERAIRDALEADIGESERRRLAHILDRGYE